ncbi:MAG: hypothetical protein GY768_06805 [Planctomycetaceae bacterium]|nr:hypothetical protein [Planctomycetaceae bacterium]
MSERRHNVRKIEPQRHESFEDRSWPVQLALVLLGAYLIGVIAATLRFDDRNLLTSAMTWTIFTVVAIGLFLVVVGQLKSHWWKRGLLFSLVLSLIVNLSVLLVLSLMNLLPPSISVVDTPVAAVQEEEQETLAEFFPLATDGDDRPKQEYEKPVTTGEPEMEQRDDVQKTSIALDSEQPQPDVPSQPQHEPLQQSVERTKLVESAPREFDSQSILSRQEHRLKPRVAPPVVDNAPSPQQTEAEQLEAVASQIQRQTPQVVRQQLDQQPEPSSRVSVQREQLSRRSENREQTEPTVPARASSLVRSESRLRPERATMSTGKRPSSSRQNSPDATPANLAIERQQTTTPEINRRPSVVVPDGVVRENDSDPTRQQPSEQSAQLAETTLPVPERRQPVTVAPSDSDVMAPQVAQAIATDQANATAEPNDLSVDKQSAQQPQPWPTPGLAAEAVTRSSEALASSAQSRASLDQSVPSASERSEIESDHWAIKRSFVPVSPLEASTEGAIASERPTADPTAAPAQTAITFSERGTTGEGESANLDQGDAAPPTPLSVASASAQRKQPTQQSRTGPAIAPAAGARIPRSLAGANTPTTNLRAQSDAAADRVDAVTVAEVEANAAAGETRRQANAPLARQTAESGESRVDIGPLRIAASMGQKQPAGGGQPQILQGMMKPAISRTRVGGALNPALPMTDTAKVVAAPPNQSPQNQLQNAGAAKPRLARQAAVASASASSRPQPSPDTSAVSEGAARVVTGGQPARSRATEATMAEVAAPGGGTNERLRTPATRAIPLGKPNQRVQVATQSASSGLPDALPLQSEGETSRRSTDGVYGPASNESVGAAADDVARDGGSGVATDLAISRRIGSAGQEVGPLFSDPVQAGDSAPRARVIRRPSGVVAKVEVDVPLAGAANARDNTPSPETAVAVQAGEVARSQSGGLVVPVDLPISVGGLSSDVAKNVGVVSRQAQPESQLVADSRARFIRRDVGGPLSIDTSVALPTEAFQTRLNRRGKDPAGGNGRPSQRTEEAIELGLIYLAKQQAPDGRWSLGRVGTRQQEIEIPTLRSDTAATGLALLSFLGAGYHHQNDKYQDVVKQGLAFLLDVQKPDGDLYLAEDEDSARNAWLYSHGIATIALCEAYGMTQDPTLREPAQRAVNFIVQAQHPRRGGWRYAPGVSSDTSVSGWMVMAMRSAELANLDVPLSAWKLVEVWLDMAQVSERRRDLYRYNPLAPNTVQQGHGRQPTPTMTAVGLLMRLYTGWRRDNQNMVLGAEFLRSQVPEIGTVRNPKRDTYYWYYATQVMFHMRGDYWEAWNRRLHPLLTSSQVQTGDFAGSWDPQDPIPDRWGSHGGRLYVTTLNLLSLEVYYRHLPIYEDTAR